MLKAGLLKPFEVGDDPAAISFAPVRVGEVDALMERFLERAEPVHEMPDDCARLLNAAACLEGRIRMHRQVLEGLIWVGTLAKETRPYASIVLRKCDVDIALMWTKHFSVSVASDLTSLAEEIIYAGCESGMIPTEDRLELRSGQMKRSLSQATVDTLRRDLISLLHLAGGKPRRAGTLKQQLNAAGLKPAIVTKNGMSAYFRADVRPWLPPRA